MLNPVKIDKYFKLESRNKTKRKKLRWLKIGGIQENNRYNTLQWNTAADVKAQLFKQYKDPHWYMINPFSIFMTVWNTIWALCYLSFVFLLPLRIFTVRHRKSLTINYSLIPVDLFFLISIPVNFLTGVYEANTRSIVYSPHIVAKRYCQKFFIVDLVSSLPYDAVVILLRRSNPDSYQLYYSLYIFYYVKLIRFETCLACIRKFLYMCYVSLTIVEAISIIIIWFITSYLLITTLYFFSTYWSFEEKIFDGNPMDVLIFVHNTTSFIFTLSSKMTSFPKGTDSGVLGQLSILFLTMLAEPFIGALVIVLYWSTRDGVIKYRSMLDEVNSYTQAMNSPVEIKKKLQDYFRMYYEEAMLMDNRKAMDFFSGHDQMIIMENLIESIASKVQLFRDLPPKLMLEIVKRLKREIMFTGYKLTIAGQIGSKMYILSTGKVLLFTESLVKIDELSEGSNIGEYQLLGDSPYPLSAICGEITTVYTLESRDFNSVVLHLTNVYTDIKQKISERYMTFLLNLELKKLGAGEN